MNRITPSTPPQPQPDLSICQSLSPRTLSINDPENSTHHPISVYLPADVARHNKSADLWVIIDQSVYNLTDFQAEHPGGDKILRKVAGKDASKEFHKHHGDGDAILRQYQDRLQVGVISKIKPSPKRGLLSRFFKSKFG